MMEKFMARITKTSLGVRISGIGEKIFNNIENLPAVHEAAV